MITTRLPAALAVGIDDLHGRDDLLLVRNARARIYLIDLKIIPENYFLAQTGVPDESGKSRFLFSPAARKFFVAEQRYAEAMQGIFAAEPDRGMVVSGNDPLRESKPFTRARLLFDQYRGTRLFLVNDW